MRSLGQNPTEAELLNMIQEVDANSERHSRPGLHTPSVQRLLSALGPGVAAHGFGVSQPHSCTRACPDSETVEFQEFCRLMQKQGEPSDTEASLREAFRM
jgi:Ca2+-binding EF-hand superfamily protein